MMLKLTLMPNLFNSNPIFRGKIIKQAQIKKLFTINAIFIILSLNKLFLREINIGMNKKPEVNIKGMDNAKTVPINNIYE